MSTKIALANVPTDLLYQALETEKGGVQVYATALRCASNKELRQEWTEYLEQTKQHVQIVTEILTKLGLDPDTETPGRAVVRYIGTSLVKAMELALPVLRADTAFYREYVYHPESPLGIPIFAYGGREDPNVRPEHLEAWREQTTAGFSRREFDGGHFFIRSAREEFLAALLEDLQEQS